MPFKLTQHTGIHSHRIQELRTSRTLERIKPFIGISDERKTHLGAHIIALGCRLRPQLSRHVGLRNLINREVLSVDVGSKLGFEWRADPAEGIPNYTAEEGVVLDFVAAADAAEAVVCVTDQAIKQLAQYKDVWDGKKGRRGIRTS